MAATVQALLLEGADLPSDNPRRDSEILLCHALDKDRAWLYTWPEAQVDSGRASVFSELLAQRRAGTPIAHLTGRRDFWSLSLAVNKHTLIPRTETETLVEWALDLSLPENAAILDLGTGSGAIALALAKEMPAASVTGLDASDEALVVARGNGVALGLSRVGFQRSDWYDAVAGKRFHLLASNPPYIDAADRHLSEGDLPHEPRQALVAGDRGLADLAQLVAGAPAHLFPGGWLLLEHGYDQGPSVHRLLRERGFSSVTTRQDIAGLDRISGGCWHVD